MKLFRRKPLEVRRIRLEPDDVLVVRSTIERLSEASAAHIRAQIEDEFPEHRVLVVDMGFDLEVLSP